MVEVVWRWVAARRKAGRELHMPGFELMLEPGERNPEFLCDLHEYGRLIVIAEMLIQYAVLHNTSHH